jgi:hypothetical protein
LKVRAFVLDREVAKKRRALGLDSDKDDDGQGRAVKITDVVPWPEPVDGDRIATTLAAAVKTYAVLPDTAADATTLWVLHTPGQQFQHLAAPSHHFTDQRMRQDYGVAFAQ